MLKTLYLVPLYILRRWGVHFFVIGISIFLLLLVQRKIYEHFSTDSRYSIDLDTFNVANCPDWLIDEQLKESVDHALSYTIKTTVFDQTLIPKLSAHYENNPWVKRIILIERRLPNDLKIKLELRRPYVAILLSRRATDTYYLVDKDFVRLPGKYRSLPAMPMFLPIITGVRKIPPLAGEIWQDRGLSAALNVVAILEENKLLKSLQTKRIDVTNIDSRLNQRKSEIVLWTRDKVWIEWGRAPDTDKFGELSVADKIKNLKLVLEVCPQLRGIRYVKIQFDQPYIALKNR